MWPTIFVILALVCVGLFARLERKRARTQVAEAKAKVKAAEVALEASEAKDKRRDDATVQTALDMSATVEAKRGSTRRPRSKVLDELR